MSGLARDIRVSATSGVELRATLIVVLPTAWLWTRRMTSVPQLFGVASSSLGATPLPALEHLVPVACAAQ
jgi:hypothetical protein